MRRTDFFLPFSHSRKGFELATSTLVVMILGVLIIGGGLALLKQVVTAGTNLGDDLPSKHRQELQELMRDGQLVAAVPQHQDVNAGTDAIAGIAIRNNLGTETTFDIKVEGLDEDQAPVTWSIRKFDTLRVKPNAESQAQVIIGVDKNAPSGTYTFVVTITENDQLYDSKRFFTIRVR